MSKILEKNIALRLQKVFLYKFCRENHTEWRPVFDKCSRKFTKKRSRVFLLNGPYIHDHDCTVKSVSIKNLELNSIFSMKNIYSLTGHRLKRGESAPVTQWCINELKTFFENNLVDSTGYPPKNIGNTYYFDLNFKNFLFIHADVLYQAKSADDIVIFEVSKQTA